MTIYGIIAVVIFLVGGLGYGKIINLQKENVQLEQKLVSIQSAYDSNLKAFEDLQKVRLKQEKVLSDNRAKQKSDYKDLDKISGQLTSNQRVETNPVILETIRKIQAHYDPKN